MATPNTRSEATEQMFAAVGRAITQWGFVEERLSHVFSVCAGTVVPFHDQGFEILDNWVPMWIFYSLETFHSKRTIVDAAVTAYIHGTARAEEFREAWGKLSQKGRQLSRKRNKLAHWFVRPAQPRGSGHPEEGFSPARLMPPIGSPSYYRETGLNPPGKTLTLIQVGHMETAFRLYSEKLRCFARALTDEPELHDKDVQQALRLLATESRLSPSVREELERLHASLR